MRTTLPLAAAAVLLFAACGNTSPDGSGGGSVGGGAVDAGTGGGGGGSGDAGPGPGGGAGNADAGTGSDGDAGTGGGLDAGSDGGAGDGGAGVDAGPDGGGGGPAPLTTLAAGERPSALALNDTDVFWIDGNQDVRTVPKSGGTPRTLTHAGASPIFMLADEVAVYWTANGTYWRAPLGGGAPGAVDTGVASGYFGSDATTAYYERYNGTATSIVVAHRARDGSGPVSINSSAGRYGGGGVTIGAGMVYWVSIGGMSMTGDDILAAPANGTGAMQVAALGKDQFATGPIKYNEGKIFYRTQDGIYSVPATGGSPTRVSNAGRVAVAALDASSGVAWWNDTCLANSTSGCVDSGGSSYGSVKVDGSAVFFVRGGDVMRLAR